MASGTDTAIDRRQADGLGKLTVNASRYVDNIIEVLSGKLMGEELRVGVREGEVFDPSPIRSMTGFKIKQPRTVVTWCLVWSTCLIGKLACTLVYLSMTTL